MFLVMSLVLLTCSIGRAQELSPVRLSREELCATPILRDPEILKEMWENTRRHSPGIEEAMRMYRLRKGIQQPKVGLQETFWVFNFETRMMDTLRAELMAAGDLGYVWVSLQEMTNGHMTGNEVNALLRALENSTPAGSQDSSKGVLQLDRQYFGDPPNINSSFEKGKGDGKTHFLVCDIKDGWTGTGGFVAGYFTNVDVDPNSGFQNSSNRRDMLYIDSYPTIFYADNRRIQVALATLAHEFQHLIHWNYDPQEITFFNEGLSEYAEHVCGYPLRSPDRYLANPSASLTSWSNELDDYSRAALWTRYLVDRFGLPLLKNLTQNKASGIPGFESAIGQSGSPVTFPAVMQRFFTANWVGSTTQVDPAYRYTQPLGSRPSVSMEHVDPNGSGSFTMRAQSVSYVLFSSSAKDFRITVQGGQDLVVRSVELGPASIRIRDHPTGTQLTFPEFGSFYTSLAFIVMNTSLVFGGSYSYASVGELVRFIVEEKYDDGVPDPPTPGFAPYVGFGNSSATRGVAVRFEPAVKGNILRKARLYLAFNQEFSNGTALATDDKDVLFHVWKDSSGRPGADVIPPFLVRVDRSKYPLNSFVDVDLSMHANLLSNLRSPVYIGYLEDEDDSVGTYVAVDKSTTIDYSYIYRGPGHPRAPKTWETFREVSALNNGLLDGFNAMFRAVFEYSDSSAGPKLAVGFLQNPILSEYIDVVVASPDELRSGSLSGTLTQPSGATPLQLNAIQGTMKAFIDTNQTLRGSGQVSIRVRAAKRFGVTYADTSITFAARLLKQEEPAIVRTPGGEFTLSAERGTVMSPTLITLFDGLSDPVWEPAKATKVLKLVSIGPPGIELRRPATFELITPSGGESLTLALYRDGKWLEVPSTFHRSSSTVIASSRRLGIFALMKKSDVDGALEQFPTAYELHQNFPNPFNPVTTIRFELPRDSEVRLAVYDLLGREVAVLVDEGKNAGSHSVSFDAGRLPTGVYFYRFSANGFSDVKKLIVLK